MSPKPAPTETILGQANQRPVANMEHGEKGIRASLKAPRARAKKPASFNETVSNKMDENLAELEAETRLQAPNDLVISSGEAVRPDFRHDQMNERDDEITHPGMVSNPKKPVIFGPIQHGPPRWGGYATLKLCPSSTELGGIRWAALDTATISVTTWLGS